MALNSLQNISAPEVITSSEVKCLLSCLKQESFLQSTWQGHLFFSHWLMDALNPTTFVELGAFYGTSFFSFCEAAKNLTDNCYCTAIDTWQGDSHTSAYGEDVFSYVKFRQETLYLESSQLLRMTFDDALEHFENGSIDLLHIDGLHTYDAVKHDFDSWLPKMSSKGVVIFHDITEKRETFGVWQLWEELIGNYPNFAFTHSCGLGIILTGQDIPDSLRALVSFTNNAAELQIRSYYQSINQLCLEILQDKSMDFISTRLFIDSGNGFSDSDSTGFSFRPEMNKIQFNFASNTKPVKNLRFDPAQTPCMVDLHVIEATLENGEIQTINTVNDNSLFKSEKILYFSTSNPQIMLPGIANLSSLKIFLTVIPIKEEAASLINEKIISLFASINELQQNLLNTNTKLENSENELRYLQESLGDYNRLKLGFVTIQQSILRSRKGRLFGWISRVCSAINRKLNILQEYLIVVKSGLFDEEYYLSRYPDVKNFGLTPIFHFLATGWIEGRDPNCAFSTSYYLQCNPDVVDTYMNPLLHYIEYGFSEGRKISPDFDADVYRSKYPDVGESGMEPLLHYLLCGIHQGRTAAKGKSATSLKTVSKGWFEESKFAELGYKVLDSEFSPSTQNLNCDKPQTSHMIRLSLKCLYFVEKHYKRKFIKKKESGLNFQGHNQIHSASCRATEDISKSKSSEPLLISVVTVLFNTPNKYLYELLRSFSVQNYNSVEFCLVDASDNTNINEKIVLEFQKHDKRIKYKKLGHNSGISSNTNNALLDSRGKYVAFVDHDDILAPDCISIIAAFIKSNKATDVLYTDQVKLDDNGYIYEPFFKPDWSKEFFRGVMYVGHLLVIRKEIGDQVGWFDSSYDRVQDYEFMLRVSERTERIAHIPQVLYAWRSHPQSIASNSDAKGSITHLQQKAVAEHLKRLGIPGIPQPIHVSHRLRIRPSSEMVYSKVTIIIPTIGTEKKILACLASIFTKTTYENFEVIILDTGITDSAILSFIQELTSKEPKLKILNDTGKFNFSKVNNIGAKEATGDYIVLLNDDTEIITEDWLQNMLYYAQQKDVGAVGALLVFNNMTVQHAGCTLGFRGTADHIMRGFPSDSDGYFGSLSCAREVSAITGACLMTSKKLYFDVGGLSEFYHSVYQDVDFCLKIREKGKRIIYTPTAQLKHHESLSRGEDYDYLDRMLLIDCWGDALLNDPYYNANFSLEYNEESTGYRYKR